MSYLAIDLLHFPDDESAQAFEAEVSKWGKDFKMTGGRIIFTGRVARDPQGKYTHCMVWEWDNFDGQRKINEDYADSLEHSSNPLGDFPAYNFDHWYGFRVAALDDPIVKKSGIAEWNKWEAQMGGERPKFKNPEKAAQWRRALEEKFLKDWPREALVKSGWIVDW